MTNLALTFLGKFEVTLNGKPLRSFSTDKVRALLVYLAVEGQAHSRSALARLLWPGYSEESARNNLRQTLFELRQTLGDANVTPPFLSSTRLTIQLNPAAAISVDMQDFTSLVAACATHPHLHLATCTECLQRLQQAADLYRGDFLADFTMDDSVEFEEWRRVMQENLHVQALDLLADLADAAEASGEDEQAHSYAQRQLTLEPWLESAHRQIMRVLARRGQRSAATAQYNLCRQVLTSELGAEPDVATTALYEQIRSGLFPDQQTPRQKGTEEKDTGEKDTGEKDTGEKDIEDEKFSIHHWLPLSAPLTPSGAFVARERELERLDTFLTQSVAGRGQVVFVSGEAGSGKTTLMRKFAQQAQEAHPELIVAGALCNAHTGAGDPYLPFRALVSLLAGGLEAGGREGLFAAEQARRLWDFMPVVIPTLVECGDDLIGSFVSGTALLARAETFAVSNSVWLLRLAALAQQASAAVLDLSRLFAQITDVLQRLATQRPLLLILDDLHWADPSSLNLLFHLGRNLANSRIMLIGAYRPEEIGASLSEKPHPLPNLLNEFKRTFGDIWIDLDQPGGVERRRFIDALLDSEANRLDEQFRQALFRHTEGHALFASELLLDLQMRGDLVRDADGYWIVARSLDWQKLPPRVEGVIEARIGRLTPVLRQVLQVASVEGEDFTAEVVARVQMMSERDLVRQLGEELERRHRMVSVQGLTWVGSQRLSRYRFRHHLFQQYLYQSLSEVEQVYLHTDMVAALETLHSEEIDQVVVRLARHCQAAGMVEKAVECLQRAGEHAQRLSAYAEALDHFRQGLALLNSLPDTPAHTKQELALQIPLSTVLIAVKGYGEPEVGDILKRALMLCQQLGEYSQRFWVLHGLHRYSLVSGEWQMARQWAEQLVNLVQERAEPRLRAEAHRAMGLTHFYLGEFALAHSQMEQGINNYQRQPDHLYLRLYGQDSGVVCYYYAAASLWMLGYSDQAFRRIEQGLALAAELAHPFILTNMYALAAAFFCFQHKVAEVRTYADAGLALAEKNGFGYWGSGLHMMRGWALALSGQGETGIAEIRQGLSDWRATGAELSYHAYLALLAEAYGTVGQSAEGLHVLDISLAVIPSSGRFLEPELYRLRGELLLAERASANAAAAEASFREAIAIAQQQNARSLELRATLSLSRLWLRQGKHEEVRQRLTEIYGWFTEGFDTADLCEASNLLAILQPTAHRPSAP